MRFWRRSGQSSNAGGFRRWFRQVVTNRKTPRNFKRKEGRSGYDTKIMSWRTRELSTIPFDLVQAKIRTSDFGEVRKAHDWVLQNVPWKSDQAVYGRKDYWATSNEVLRRMVGDCDDQSIAMWRKMRDAGLGDDKIELWLLNGNRQGHMVAAYRISVDDAYVLDNGYMTRDIVLASELFADSSRCKNMRPVAGFNLWKDWIFK